MPSVVISKKLPERERLKERWLDTQELSGGPFRISAINRHRQFALLHAAAKAQRREMLMPLAEYSACRRRLGLISGLIASRFRCLSGHC